MPVPEVVVSDLMVLRAGDVVPAGCRLTKAQRLQVDRSALTGEAFPVEKTPGEVPTDADLTGRTNALWMGTHVVSRTGHAVVMRTGRDTAFAGVAGRVAATGFQRGHARHAHHRLAARRLTGAPRPLDGRPGREWNDVEVSGPG